MRSAACQLVGIRFLPPLQINRGTLWIDLLLLGISLPRLVRLPVGWQIGLLSRIVDRCFSRVVFRCFCFRHKLSSLRSVDAAARDQRTPAMIAATRREC